MSETTSTDRRYKDGVLRDYDEMPTEYGRIVSMVKVGDETIIATERRVFKLKPDGLIEPMRFQIETAPDAS